MSAACACGAVDLVAGAPGHGLSSCAGVYRLPPAVEVELIAAEELMSR